MNGRLFLDAMEGISDTYIISAQERLGCLTARKGSKIRAIRRAFAVALAAVLVVACTLAAAMAVSPELREMIISLFQVGEVERVPDIPAGANEVKQVTIGGEVSAQYVKVEGSWGGEDEQGLLQWLDGDNEQALEERQTHFYDIRDGQLVEVGADASEISAALSWYGRDIDVPLRFFVHDGMLYLCDGSGGSRREDAMTFVVTPERLGSRTDVALLRGECYGSEVDTNWAWVCDLKTGEVRDVLAGCGIEEFVSIGRVLLAEDLKHALVRGWDGASGSGMTPYLVDLEAKTRTPLSQLMDLDIPTAFGSYEAMFYDSDTVLLAMAPLWRPEPSSVWVYHIPSGTVTPTVTEESGLFSIWSGESYGWSLAQRVDEDGTVTILDLRTGGRVKLEGITVAEGEHCSLTANPSRTKLLWVERGDNGVSRLGVVDLESGVFTAIRREDTGVRRSEPVFWLGDDRVVVMMDLRPDWDVVRPGEEYDYDVYSQLPQEYYLCVYEF